MTASIYYRPFTYEPVNSGFGINIGLTSSAYSEASFKYVYDVGYFPGGTSSYETLGQFKIAPRITGNGVYDVSNALKTITETNPYWGVVKGIPPLSGDPTGNDSLLQAGYGLKRWAFKFGWEYNPYLYVNKIDQYSFYSNARLNFGAPHNFVLGDYVRFEKTNGTKNPELNGISEVVQITSATQCLIEKAPWSDLVDDTGRITYLSRIEGYCTQSQYNDSLYTFNAVKDFNYNYNEDDVDSIVISSNPLLTNWAPDTTKQIYPSQPEAVSFIADPNNANQQVVATNLRVYTDSSKTNQIGNFTHSTSMSSWSIDSNRHFVIGCGMEEISYITGWTLSSADIGYYEIDLIGNSTTFTTIKREVNRICYNEIYTLAWLNRKGGYDFFSFPKIKKEVINATRNIFNTNLQYNDNTKWGGGRTSNRQRNVGSVLTEEVWTLQTDYLTETENDFLKDLITSNNVWLVRGATIYEDASPVGFANTLPTPVLVGVNIVDDSWTSKKRLVDGLFDLKVQIRFSYNHKNFSM